MGKKTEQIQALTAELTAARFLLRGMGDTVGVEIDTVTMESAPAILASFVEALRVAGPPTDVAVPTPRTRPVGNWDTFDDDVDDQIDRMKAQGLTTPLARGGAMVTRENRPSAGEGENDILETIASIARELGVPTQSVPADTLSAIHDEVLRIKNIGADVQAPSTNKALSKGDSLADAFAHAHQQNSELRDGASQARVLVNRIAAAMQIGEWDADGTQLLERVQRYEHLKHELKTSIRNLARPAATIDEQHLNEKIASELQAHLTRLMAPKELSDWMKARPKAVSAQVAALASAPALVPPYPFTFRRSDVAVLGCGGGPAGSLEPGAESPRSEQIADVFGDVSGSVMISDEFVKIMNVVILPLLARQKALTTPAAE